MSELTLELLEMYNIKNSSNIRYFKETDNVIQSIWQILNSKSYINNAKSLKVLLFENGLTEKIFNETITDLKIFKSIDCNFQNKDLSSKVKNIIKDKIIKDVINNTLSTFNIDLSHIPLFVNELHVNDSLLDNTIISHIILDNIKFQFKIENMFITIDAHIKNSILGESYSHVLYNYESIDIDDDGFYYIIEPND